MNQMRRLSEHRNGKGDQKDSKIGFFFAHQHFFYRSLILLILLVFRITCALCRCVNDFTINFFKRFYDVYIDLKLYQMLMRRFSLRNHSSFFLSFIHFFRIHLNVLRLNENWLDFMDVIQLFQ